MSSMIVSKSNVPQFHVTSQNNAKMFQFMKQFYRCYYIIFIVAINCQMTNLYLIEMASSCTLFTSFKCLEMHLFANKQLHTLNILFGPKMNGV